MKNYLGMFLLGIWLILQGLVALINLSFSYSNQILAVIGIIAGLLIIIKK